jgi:glutathione S-transferase
VVDGHLQSHRFIIGEHPTIADFSMCGYLFFPEEESGLQFAQRFPSIRRWLEAIRAMPGWADPYDILPGQRLAPRW